MQGNKQEWQSPRREKGILNLDLFSIASNVQNGSAKKNGPI
jgi:hypothetical protein